jgi:hypothetical protein
LIWLIISCDEHKLWSWPLCNRLRSPVTSSLLRFLCLCCAKESVPVRGSGYCFVRNYGFLRWELNSRPIPKLEVYFLSTGRDWLFIPESRLLHPQSEDAPSRGDKGPT